MALLSEKLDLKHALRFKRSADWEKPKKREICGLGLRAGEVACLKLDDIDWNVGYSAPHGPVQVCHARLRTRCERTCSYRSQYC